MHPHGSSWSVIVSNTCLIGPGAHGVGWGGELRAQRKSRTSPNLVGSGPAILLPQGCRQVAPAHSPGPVALGSMLQPGGAGIRICGRACQGQRPGDLGLGRDCAYVRPRGGGVAAPSEAPSPILIVAAAMARPGPFPAPQPGPVHTPYLGPGTWLMPRCPPGVFSSWGAQHGRWRSGEAAEVLAWPAGPCRAPRPGLAGPLGRAREELPGGRGSAAPSLPPGRLRQCPDK